MRFLLPEPVLAQRLHDLLLQLFALQFRCLDAFAQLRARLLWQQVEVLAGECLLHPAAGMAQRTHHLAGPGLREREQGVEQLRGNSPVMPAVPVGEQQQIDIEAVFVLQAQAGFADLRQTVDAKRVIPEGRV